MLDRFFRLRENGTSVRTEVMAGLTTFFAMAYIVFVNPNQVAANGSGGWLAALGADAGALGQIWNSVFVASVLGAVIGTLMYAFVARLPFAQACGMGLNAFFCTCFVSGAYFAGVDVIDGYQAGMVIIFISGILFLLLSVTGLRTLIAKSMPDCLKKAIPAGIGLFIAFIGFQNVGLIQPNQYTLVQFYDFHGVIDSIGTDGVSAFDAWCQIAPVLVTFLGLLLIAVLYKKKVKGSVMIGILASAVLYYLFTLSVPHFDISGIGQSFRDFGEIGITGLFQAASWKNAFTGANIGGIFNALILIMTFCLVDMFDTLGTLYGTAAEAGMLDENGDPIRVEQAMLCDSVATVSGGVLGTSTVTTFVESASGVAAGGRTGLTSLVTGLCFALCLFLSPVADMIPSCAPAPALIFVGVLMLKNFGRVDMEDIASAVPAFLTLIMMPRTYSIANGIGIGAIAYTLITLFTGKYRKRDLIVTVISILFILKFVFVTM